MTEEEKERELNSALYRLIELGLAEPVVMENGEVGYRLKVEEEVEMAFD